MKNINTVFVLLFIFIFASCKTLGSIQTSDHHAPEPHVSEHHMPPTHAPTRG